LAWVCWRRGLATPTLIAFAVLLLGLSLGAEGDVIAYLVARYFKPEVYSTVLGLVLGALAFAIAVGALLLSVMLRLTGSFTPYLVVVAVAALVGAGMLALLGRLPTDRW
jgi:predicted MFS family arabinose efflux permease